MSQVTGFADLPRWDLTDLYQNSKDPKIASDIANLKVMVDKFVNDYSNGLNEQSFANDLFKAITQYESINELFSKLMSFSGLQYYSDLNNDDFKHLYQKLQEDLTPLASQLVFFRLLVANLSKDKVKKALSECKDLQKYAYWLELAAKYQPHQLSEELERYIEEKSVTGRGAWVRLYDETLATMSFDFEGSLVPLEAVTHKMGDKDPKVRKNAAISLSQGLEKNLSLFTTVTNVLAKDKAIDDTWRKFKTPYDSRHLDNQVDPEVVQALVDSVVEAYPKLSHRYYAQKAKELGLERLEYWDRNAPLGDDDQEISWPQARQTVLEAYGSFSSTLRETILPFFDNNWIDVPSVSGKTSGAFSHPCVPSVHPYVLLNFQNKRRDVMTLAHELGHGAHQMLAREQGYLLADTPLTLAETASVFGEMLTFQHMLKNSTDAKAKKALLGGKIDDMLNTVVRQIAFYRFEQNVHNMRQQGELVADDLAHLWQRSQAEALGPSVNIDPMVNNFWAYISHFIHTPFYVYAYAFGDCLVNSLYAFYIQNPEGFEEKYLNLLRAGGSKNYTDLLQPFGFNLNDKSFWSQGLKMIEDMIIEWEKL